MISDTLFTATFDVSDAKETAQRAIGSALRISTEEVTREHLPGSIALLLVTVAFAEVMGDIAQEEAEAC
jgi:hypothetical protein